jgi:kynureninase
VELEATEACARRLDRGDSLASFRNEFSIPPGRNGDPSIYLCGNSLGLMPRKAREYVDAELDDWARLGVGGHFRGKNPWMPYHALLRDPMARIVGALPSEVVVMNSLTANLHLLLVAFYRPTPRRFRILVEGGAFPSDRYAVKSQALFHGYDPDEAVVEVTPRPGEDCLRPEDVLRRIDEEGDSTALVLFGNANYYTGQSFDVAAIARAGQEKGCRVGFDLAHGAGNLPLALHDDGPDFAVWCSYKYLNGGPGAVAAAFVHERHHDDESLPRFSGWWGHDEKTRFEMGPEFRPISGADGFQLSNPPILQMAALRASLELFDRAGMRALREKSERLTAYLELLLEDLEGFRVITPSGAEERGAQLSLLFEPGQGRAVHRRLESAGVVCDYREPDVVRVAPVPIYNTFLDVYRFASILRESL